MTGRDPIIDMQTCTEAEFMAWQRGYGDSLLNPFPWRGSNGVARVPPGLLLGL
jgi:hypothetical protein